jgi:hypothetical protein
MVADGHTEKHGNIHDQSNKVEQVVWKEVKPGIIYTIKVRVRELMEAPQPYAFAWRLCNVP